MADDSKKKNWRPPLRRVPDESPPPPGVHAPPALPPDPAAPLPDGDMRVSFGRFRGRLVREVPTPYLVWMLKEIGLSKVYREYVARVIRARGHAADGGGVMGFGRYYGFAYAEIPLDYLAWVAAEADAKMLTDADRAQIRQILADAGHPPGGGPVRPPPDPEAPYTVDSPPADPGHLPPF